MLLGEPAFHHIGAVLGFPFLQQLVIAAFGFNDLAVMWVLVLLDLTGATRGLFNCCRSKGTTVCLRIQDVDDVTQTEAILGRSPLLSSALIDPTGRSQSQTELRLVDVCRSMTSIRVVYAEPSEHT